MTLRKRKLGKTGAYITVVGLGGEGVLRMRGKEEASALINRAVDLGINYFESARSFGESESCYGKALKKRRKDVFLASKAHARDKNGAIEQLKQTLASMKTSYLDLWQIHDVGTEEEMAQIFGPKGALDAFVRAKEKGYVRFIGLTGYRDPAIIRKCLESYDFDTVLIPVNPAEPSYRSFIEEVLPVASEKGIGVIGIKVYPRGVLSRVPWLKDMHPFMRFALTQDIASAVISCDNIGQLETNILYARGFVPMKEVESKKLIDALAPHASDLMYYKSSTYSA